MKQAFIVFVLFGLTAAPAAAQGRGNGRNQIPPGHLPAAGECRVWYDGVPPGRQPRPTSCAEAERTAARDRNARVIYGSDRDDRYRDDRWARDDDWRRQDDRSRTGGARERAVPRTDRYPDAYPYPDDRYPSQRDGSFAFRQGYEDGIVKGREDTRDGDSFDPARHSWYKSANRGYDSRYGSREQYREQYRDGFLDGYRAEYRGRDRGTNSGGRPGWWPF
jgi:hypothetical protein